MLDTIEVNGVSCVRLQQKDAKPVLGISHKTFYKDAENAVWGGPWKREPGPRGTMIYSVPMEYVVHRQREMEQLQRSSMEVVESEEWSGVELHATPERSSMVSTGESQGGLLSFMERTMDKLDQYHGEIVSLARENSQYKLLSDNHTRSLGELEIENRRLTQVIFEKEARIRELEEKLQQKGKSWRFWGG